MQPAAKLLADQGDPRQTGAVTRPITHGSAQELAAFGDPDLLAAGKVTLLSLEAITDKLGGQWQARRAEAYDRAARVLGKRVAAGGASLRISETDFLVVQPGLTPIEAEDAALRFLTEILTLFLGEPKAADLRMFRVGAVSEKAVTAAPCDPDEVRRNAEAARRARTVAKAAKNVLSEDRWSPFIAGDGRRVRPSCVLEPVFELSSNKRIGYRLRRRVVDMATDQPLPPAQVASLPRADVLRIDVATIARGMARLQATLEAEPELSLIIPVSHLSLTSQEGAAMLLLAFGEARQAVRAGIICEVCDIDELSPAALTAAVAVIRPWSLIVVGHLAGEKPQASTAMKTAGIQAVSIACPAHIEGDAEFIGWLRAAMKASQKVGRSTIVYGCTSPRRLAMAGLLGASHASMATPDNVVKL